MFDVKGMGKKEFEVWQEGQIFANIDDGKLDIQFSKDQIENSFIISIDEMFAMPQDAIFYEQELI
ncbi:hypothetical protein [Helicobacter trogontum]|uniref:Uncharacterized protein n=1 Tax=Helicobacter trogontum TaxID=50960 RepID=A0A099VCG1_9HELI|nr:hypothetical protein [Helicobacter trogontum]TLD84677.1 hypothetical protein LS81_001315 [Helicobacter trogontum]